MVDAGSKASDRTLFVGGRQTFKLAMRLKASAVATRSTL
jgi:hypothetical protein